MKTTECPNVFQIPESEDDFLSLVGEIKERVRQLAIDDDQTGPQVSKRLKLKYIILIFSGSVYFLRRRFFI